MMVQPLHIRGAHIWDGHQTAPRDLYTSDVVLGEPAPGALTVDLDGYTIFPGLINAHDHLELNHYPRSKFREKYDNAHQWGEDMNARLDTEPYKSLRAYPLWDRLFIGGLKNLLCGATTVAHHNPPHKDLWHKDFPVRVLKKYGWTHSLHFSTDEEIVRSYRSTPPDVPWFIHLAEGTDEVAAGEYKRLKDLGCVGQNTVIVHGVGLGYEDAGPIIHHVHGLVICPSTNQYLLQKYPTNLDVLDSPTWVYGFMALGSDSRLTSAGDLLDEMRFTQAHVFDEDTLNLPGIWKMSAAYCSVRMTTCDAAHVLKVPHRGALEKDYLADWVTIRSAEDDEVALCQSRRADLALVVKGGLPQIGDPDVMAKFPHVQTVAATLDGKPKRIHIDLARRIHQCKLKEPGLEVDELPKRRFAIW
jgi:cytosine/adenosine deaminase-related metal-dependent hydrolase